MAGKGHIPPKLEGIPAVGAVFSIGLTACVFMILPLTQKLAELDKKEKVYATNIANEPPPDPPEIEEPPEEEEEEEEEPEIEMETPPPSLDQLNLMMNPELVGGIGGDFSIPSFSMKEALGDLIFSINQLDTPPSTKFQPKLKYPPEMANLGIGGEVRVEMYIDADGNVSNARIISASHPGFKKSALEFVQKIKFNPGIKDGKRVRTKVQLPFRFEPQ